MPAKKIPIAAPRLAGNERRYVNEVVRSGWISSSGSAVRRFESEFAAYCGSRHGIAVSSGTAALHLALRSANVGPGDEVIIPDFTMIAVAYAVLYCGARPVLADVETDTGNLDASRLEAKFSRRTKAVIAVHTYGHPCDLDPLLKIARRHKALVIEDAAEAHGALYKGKRCGGIADLGVFSFYANKIVTTGEGGMVVTNNTKLAARCRYLRDLCFTPGHEHDFRHDEIGFNYRLSSLQAALGIAQLEKITDTIARKKRIAAHYNKALSGLKGLELPAARSYASSVYWMYGIRLTDDAPITREKLRLELSKRGIETRVFFYPMHLQKCLKGRVKSGSLDRKTSVSLSEMGLCLPCGAGLTSKQLSYVSSAIRALWGLK
jgi:perosamine synthetase